MSDNSLEIIFDFNVNFMHFIDSLSQWSPYCGDTALNLFTSYFEFNEKDQDVLRKYKVIRNKLGWDNETNLFLWALKNFSQRSFFKHVCFEFTQQNEEEYSLKSNKEQIFKNLAYVIKYFQERKNEKTCLIDILKNRHLMMSRQVERIKRQINLAQEEILKISDLLYIFADCLDFKDHPIFICFGFNNGSLNGGANGKGIYAEFPLVDDEAKFRYGIGLIIHEMLHKIVNIKGFLDKFINSNKSDILFSNLSRILEERDPEGFGREIDVFEEIIVYLFSDVYICNLSIEEKINVYRNEEGLKEFYRIWYGVKLFKEMFDKYSCKVLNDNEFVLELLKIFHEKVYYQNFDIKSNCS